MYFPPCGGHGLVGAEPDLTWYDTVGAMKYSAFQYTLPGRKQIVCQFHSLIRAAPRISRAPGIAAALMGSRRRKAEKSRAETGSR